MINFYLVQIIFFIISVAFGTGTKSSIDLDGDGVNNIRDNCPMHVNADQADNDSDGVGNTCDNCINTANTDQLDSDGNGTGDECAACQTSYSERRKHSIPLVTEYFPVQFHVLANSSGERAKSNSEIGADLARLNETFAPTNIQFFSKEVNIIVDDTNYGITITGTIAKTILTPFYNNQAIHILVAPKVTSMGFAIYGSDFNYIAYELNSSFTTLAHEMGHYFSLLHTHSDSTSSNAEYVARTNCTSKGDSLCDTPADPGQSYCKIIGAEISCSIKDPNGDSYQPDFKNLMSYYNKTRNSFSTQQMKVMWCVSNSKSYIKNMKVTKVATIDFGKLNLSDYITVGCSESTDSGTIQEAIDNIAYGGIIELCNGTYNESLVSNTGNFTMRGRSGHTVVIDGNNSSNILSLPYGGDYNFSNLTFSNGLAARSGGAINGSDVDINFDSVTFNSNVALASSGGALIFTNSNVNLINSHFSYNEDNSSCGAISVLNTNVSIADSDFISNESGICIYNSDSGYVFSIENTSITGTTNGTALALTNVAVSAKNNSISDNINSSTVGIISLRNVSTCDFFDNQIINNQAMGILQLYESSCNLSGGSISGNTIDSGYGAIHFNPYGGDSSVYANSIDWTSSGSNASYDIIIRSNRYSGLLSTLSYECTTISEECNAY